MPVASKVSSKLQDLPDKPGVYLMRDRSGRIIYVGKAASLRSRVRSYFQAGTLRSAPPKLRGLIHSVDDLEYIVLPTEADAIITEGKLIKEYKPKYNVYFKDDKRFLMLRVQLADPFPRFEPCRVERKDGATYFGPYTNAIATRATLEFVEKRFGIRRCRPAVPVPEDHKHCLNDIVRYCAAPCIGKVTAEEYRRRVETACGFLRGEHPEYLKELGETMEAEAKALHFEKAAALRDTLLMLRGIIRERIRSRKSLEILSSEARAGAEEIQRALGLARAPRVIECFDISNISGTHAVASMVCAVDGQPQRNRYRHFRIKTVSGIDDPGMMAEVIRRRYARMLGESAALPDLVIVDGGITQLQAARAELRALGLPGLPSAGLAKRLEELYWGDDLSVPTIRFPAEAQALNVLKRIRDEAHRFALAYHRRLRARRIRDSLLDEVEGIGEKRKELLLAHFGSVARLRRASVDEISQVGGIGPVMAEAIRKTLAGSGRRPDEEKR